MERFDVDGRYTWLGLGCRPEYRGSSFEQQRLPGRDLVRMDIELLRKLGQHLLALDGGQSHLRLESRAVIPARSSRHRLSCSRAILAAVRQKLHLSTCPNLPSQLFPPSSVSFPRPPTKLSLPLSPKRWSLPPSPESESLPPRQYKVSAELVPAIL